VGPDAGRACSKIKVSEGASVAFAALRLATTSDATGQAPLPSVPDAPDPELRCTAPPQPPNPVDDQGRRERSEPRASDQEHFRAAGDEADHARRDERQDRERYDYVHAGPHRSILDDTADMCPPAPSHAAVSLSSKRKRSAAQSRFPPAYRG
jgi:hypothetical protein